MEQSFRPRLSLWAKLGILLVMFFTLLCVAALLQGALAAVDMPERTRLLIGSAAQCLLAFVVPPLVVARFSSARPAGYLGLSSAASWKWYAAVAVLFVVAASALNQLIYWNAHMRLPESMSALERTLRGWEDDAARLTETILSGTSWGTLLSGVLVVGLLTGFSEEMFFRAGIQRALSSSGMNPHLAVWTAALIFSAVHFQFFGFFPRLLLGAFFGYLYLRSGSLWVAAAAHALNNSIVVVSSWLEARGAASFNPEEVGVAEQGFPFWALASAVVTALTVYLMIKASKRNGTAKL